MKILILGATGRTGKHIVSQALARGHEVSVLVRDAAKIETTSAKLHVFEGVSTDKQALRNSLNGCEALLNALNISRTSDFPWASLRTPKDFLSQTMQNILEVANELRVRRIVILSAWGVNETQHDIPFWFRWVIANSNIRYGYEEHARQEDMLRKTALDWTVIRPVGLTNSLRPHRVRISFDNQPRPSLTISRLQVAKCMIDAVETNSFIRQCPTISKE